MIGRKSGQTISIPVWFVFESDTLYLLPVHGSETQWYRNVVVGAQCTPGQLTQYRVERADGERFWAQQDELNTP